MQQGHLGWGGPSSKPKLFSVNHFPPSSCHASILDYLNGVRKQTDGHQLGNVGKCVAFLFKPFYVLVSHFF